MALASRIRDLTPSFWKTFLRWYSTVFGLMKSWEPIARLVSPSAASPAIWNSRTVRSEADSPRMTSVALPPDRAWSATS